MIDSNQCNMASEEHVQQECNRSYLQINFHDLLTRLHCYMVSYPKQNFKYIPILVPIRFQIPEGALRQPPSRRSPNHRTLTETSVSKKIKETHIGVRRLVLHRKRFNKCQKRQQQSPSNLLRRVDPCLSGLSVQKGSSYHGLLRSIEA